jgi:hypothetical protein
MDHRTLDKADAILGARQAEGESRGRWYFPNLSTLKRLFRFYYLI